MRLNEYLGAFSVEDLRELAARRGVRLSTDALQGRQTLVRTLAAVLSGYDNLYYAVPQLNQAELGVLTYLLQLTGTTGISALAKAANAEESVVKGVLDGLRLWGLVFPEGNWQHIALPPSTKAAANFLGVYPGSKIQVDFKLVPPALLFRDDAAVRRRDGSLGWDLAELLARVARSRFKLTQAGRMNRRDLRTMEAAFAIPNAGYAAFLMYLVGGLGLLVSLPGGVLTAAEYSDAWFAQSPETRAAAAAAGWHAMRGYPENADTDPVEVDYLNNLAFVFRRKILDLLKSMDPARTVNVESLADHIAWHLPWGFRGPMSTSRPLATTARLVRSCYWLGLLQVDDPNEPRYAKLSALGAVYAGRAGESGDALIPDDPQFFLQPNAEIFAPPNLSPRSYFHVRRLTAEKKGGAAGTFPLTADSLRRALDSGVEVAQITHFLEQFSRTGLPPNVRALVETAGRQHGRIRLVPAGYVVVTDEPLLLEEIRRLKTVAPLVGPNLADRVATVESGHVPELMRNLRARGYAPLDQAEIGNALSLPADPNSVPPAPRVGFALQLGRGETELDWSAIEDQGDEGPPRVVTEPSAPVHTFAEILALLGQARTAEREVQVEYLGDRYAPKGTYVLWPMELDARYVEAFCLTTEDYRFFDISKIGLAFLTGQPCEWEE